MRSSDFNRLLLPIAVTDRKSAANAIAAGVLIGSLLALLSGVAQRLRAYAMEILKRQYFVLRWPRDDAGHA